MYIYSPIVNMLEKWKKCHFADLICILPVYKHALGFINEGAGYMSDTMPLTGVSL